jgi:hypothetical protein
MLAFADIPAGTTTNNGFGINEVNCRLVEAAVAPRYFPQASLCQKSLCGASVALPALKRTPIAYGITAEAAELILLALSMTHI